MKATRAVQKILQYYETDNHGVKGILCRILMNGKLGGTGKMIILPVDQGFEHGPARSFALIQQDMILTIISNLLLTQG